MRASEWPFSLTPGERDTDVICLGHALVDRLAYVEDGGVERMGLEPGIMVLVDDARAFEIERAVPNWEQVAGGSAANTAAGVASLGGRAAFVGAVGQDELGRWYSTDLEAAGVRCVVGPELSGRPTGVCHVLVTNGGSRSMATHLGAASWVPSSAAEAAGLPESTILYIEGYLLDAEAAPAVDRAISIAREAGTLTALSLSDPFVVARHHDRISEMVEGGLVDVLFGNEDEALRLTGTADLPAAADRLRRQGMAAVITRGAKGSVAVLPVGTVEVPAHEVDPVVDTTGAGDLFAAGCLYAIAGGNSPEHSLFVGSYAAGEIISHMGARPEVNLRDTAPADLVSSSRLPLPGA